MGTALAAVQAPGAPTVQAVRLPVLNATSTPPAGSSFGLCRSLANPLVASATASAFGVLMPMPCVSNVAGPWVPGSMTVLVGGEPALDSTSTCMCLWGGEISIVQAGQQATTLP